MKGLIRKECGWEFYSDKRVYGLYEGICLDSDEYATTDICFIMDESDLEKGAKFAGFVYGATFVKDPQTRHDWEKAIGEVIKLYEQRKQMPNGIARIEHAKKIAEAYLCTNEEVLDSSEVEEIKKDVTYLTRLIKEAKMIQEEEE